MKNKNRIDLKYKPKKCVECGGKLIELQGFDPDGTKVRYWHCVECGDEVLDMEQLHAAILEERSLAKMRRKVKISKWGTAIAIRIPKEIAQKQKLKPGTMMHILPERSGFKVVPEKE